MIDTNKQNRNKIVGLDFFTTVKNPNMTVKVCSVGASSVVGTESMGDIVHSNDVLLKNITAKQYKDLLSGEAYLEFWIEAIDHTRPTVNNRLYSEHEFKLGMDKVLNRVINNGGFQPGEHIHPSATFDPKLTEAQNVEVLRSRLLSFDQNKISHYVCDTKTENGKTYFKIRTSTKNKVIVNEIAIGKVPTFSIRTLGLFNPNPAGILIGTELLVITSDYVYNPANATSRPTASNIKFIDPTSNETVKVTLEPKPPVVGVESNDIVDLFDLSGNEEMIIAVESDSSFTMNIVSKQPIMSREELLSSVFNKVF